VIRAAPNMSYRYQAVAQSCTRTLLAGGHQDIIHHRSPAYVRCRYGACVCVTSSTGSVGDPRRNTRNARLLQKTPQPVRVLRGEGEKEREKARFRVSHGLAKPHTLCTHAWTGADRVPLSGGSYNQLTVRRWRGESVPFSSVWYVRRFAPQIRIQS
jgi:hypothetical protein